MKTLTDFLKEANKPVPVPIAGYVPTHGSHSKPKKKKKPLKEGFNDYAEYHDYRSENPNPHLGHDIHDVHNKLNHSREEWHKVTEPHEREGVRSYTEYSNMVNNNLMRAAQGKKPTFEHHHLDSETEKADKDDDKNTYHTQVHGLDSLLHRSTAPHDITVMHGISPDASKTFHPGNEASKHPERHLKFPSYLSTSIDPRTAFHFADPWSGNHDTHVLKIHVKKGQSGFKYIGSHSATDEDEKEAIIKRNTTMKIGEKPTTLDHPSGRKVHVWDAHIVD